MVDSRKTILCPTDFSDPARTAFNTAREMAEALGAKLHLLNVILPLPHGPSYADMDSPEYVDLARKHATGKLQELAREAGDVEVETEVRHGEPYEEIISAALELKPKMLVISTHGRKGIQRLVFGSVTEKVVKLADCPVLTVRMKAEEGE
ncbi:MAG: universal stress protein [Desulfatibacillaceae bacterium]